MLPRLKTACIIDDDSIYIKLVTRLLELKNLCSNILVFKNGKEAIDFFNNSTSEKTEQFPDLILLDINMPIMNGWEFLEEFENVKSKLVQNPNLYVVSSSIDPLDFAKAEQSEAVTEYITKPISIQAFERIFNSPI